MNYGPQPPGAFRSDRSRDPRLEGGRPEGGRGAFRSERSRDPRLEDEGSGRRDPRFDDQEESYDDVDDDRDARPPVIDVSAVLGLPFARDRLLPWFRKIVDSVEEAQNPLRVTLAQRAAQGGLQAITTIEHDLESPPDETINQLLQIAVEDICGAHFIGKKLTYALSVPLSNGSPSLQNFVLEIPRPRGTAFTDPPRAQHFPDPSGVIGHFMDRDLQLTQLAVEGGSRGVDLLERDIERKTEEIRELKEENRRLRASQFDRDREMQILVDGNLKRQFMVDEHRAKVDRDAAIGEGFKAIMPQLLPLILPQQMAQALAVPLAMATASTQNGGGPPGGPPGDAPATMRDDDAHAAPPVDMGAMPGAGMPGMPDDTALIDELIHELEEDQPFFVKLFHLMGEKPRCAELLAMLYQSSRNRQQQRAGRVRPNEVRARR